MQTIKIQKKHYASHLAEHFASRGQIVMLQNVGSKMILTLEKRHRVARTKSKSMEKNTTLLYILFVRQEGGKNKNRPLKNLPEK